MLAATDSNDLNGTYVSSDIKALSVAQFKNDGKITTKPRADGKAEKQSHPRYKDMVQVAVGHLAGRSGVSKTKICDFIKDRYRLEEVNNHYIKKALKELVADNVLQQPKGTGASGSFKLGKEKKEAMKASEAKAKTQTEPKTETKSEVKSSINGRKLMHRIDEKENKLPKKKKEAVNEMKGTKERALKTKPAVGKQKAAKPISKSVSASSVANVSKAKNPKKTGKSNSTSKLDGMRTSSKAVTGKTKASRKQ